MIVEYIYVYIYMERFVYWINKDESSWINKSSKIVTSLRIFFVNGYEFLLILNDNNYCVKRDCFCYN